MNDSPFEKPRLPDSEPSILAAEIGGAALQAYYQTEQLDLEEQEAAEARAPVDRLYYYRQAIDRATPEGWRRLTHDEEIALGKDIEAGLYARYKLDNEAFLDQAQEELQQIAAQGEKSFHKLAIYNLRLVAAVARRYSEYARAPEEVTQYGNLGLLKAIRVYDYAKGLPFAVTAVPWIAVEIRRGMSYLQGPLYIPLRHRDIKRDIARLEDPRDSLTSKEFARRYGLSPAKVTAYVANKKREIIEVDRFDKGAASIETILDGTTEGFYFANLEEAVAYYHPELEGTVPTLADVNHPLLAPMSPRYKEVIARLMGFWNGTPQSYEDVAAAMGITRDGVIMLRRKGLEQLRKAHHFPESA